MSLTDKVRKKSKEKKEQVKKKAASIISKKPINDSIQEQLITEIVTDVQVRKEFNQEKLQELAISMKENGLINPIVVRPVDGKLVVVAGERRLRAAKILGWESIKVIVKNVTKKEADILAMIENLQREDLSPIEEAQGYNQLMKEEGYSVRELSNMLGKSKSIIQEATSICKVIDFTIEHPEAVRSTGHLNNIPRYALVELGRITNEPFFTSILNLDFSEIRQKELRKLIKKEKEKNSFGYIEAKKRKKDYQDKFNKIINTMKDATGDAVNLILNYEKDSLVKNDEEMENKITLMVNQLTTEFQRGVRVLSTVTNGNIKLDANITITSPERNKNIKIDSKEDSISYPQFGNFPYLHFSLTSTKTNNNTVQLLLDSQYSFISYREDKNVVREIITECVPELAADKIFDNPDIKLGAIVDQWNALPFQKVDSLPGYLFSAITKNWKAPRQYKDLRKKAMANLKVIENFEKDKNYTAIEMKESNPARYELCIQELFQERPYDLTKDEDKKLFYLALEAKFNTK